MWPFTSSTAPVIKAKREERAKALAVAAEVPAGVVVPADPTPYLRATGAFVPSGRSEQWI